MLEFPRDLRPNRTRRPQIPAPWALVPQLRGEGRNTDWPSRLKPDSRLELSVSDGWAGKRTLPPNGHVHAPDLTPAIQAEMIQKITERCLADFFPYGIPVVHLVEVSRERD